MATETNLDIDPNQQGKEDQNPKRPVDLNYA
jgi:hypothetical protein